MKLANVTIAVYAVVDIVDGIQGFLSGSKLPWLIWNVGFGLAVLLGLVVSARKPFTGFAICSVFATLDFVFFGRRLMLRGEFWPAGLTTLVALIALVAALAAAFQASRLERQRSREDSK